MGPKIRKQAKTQIRKRRGRGRTDVIVTTNLKDFPAEKLKRWGIEVQHPDEVLTHQFRL